MIGFVGSILPLLAIYVIYDKVVAYISGRFSVLNSLINFLPASTIMKTLIPMSIILGVGIGFVGSMATVKKHLTA